MVGAGGKLARVHTALGDPTYLCCQQVEQHGSFFIGRRPAQDAAKGVGDPFRVGPAPVLHSPLREGPGALDENVSLRVVKACNGVFDLRRRTHEESPLGASKLASIG